MRRVNRRSLPSLHLMDSDGVWFGPAAVPTNQVTLLTFTQMANYTMLDGSTKQLGFNRRLLFKQNGRQLKPHKFHHPHHQVDDADMEDMPEKNDETDPEALLRNTR